MPKRSIRLGLAGRSLLISEPTVSITDVKLGHLGLCTASQAAMSRQILQWLANPKRESKNITYVNPHVFNLSVEHPDVQRWIEQSDLVCVDGIGLIAAQYCSASVCWHIGAGTIETWAGTKCRAPAWFSRFGVQWLHRMVFEPHTRSRYLRGFFEFLWNVKNAGKVKS